MGIHAKLSPLAGHAIDQDAGPLSPDELLWDVAPNTPISGQVWRNGRAIPFTLDTTGLAPDIPRIVPEQIAIAALLMASFIAPIWHLMA